MKTGVVVIGGGHAGCEAAAASARMGAETVLVTHRFDTVGVMSCNPAIGGVGKGHLVREIDALDGLMGRIADRSGIQFRLLNRRKGPAVRGPRAQIDRAIYREAMQAEIGRTRGLSVVEAEVTDLLVKGGRVCGVSLADGSTITGDAIVLTTGTFLRGMIHLGERSFPAGRAGEDPAIRLGQRLEDAGLAMGRLKTGTPPRLDGRSIDWSVLAEQPGDVEPVPFSFLTDRIDRAQVPCHITHTNQISHEIIAGNLERSAMYGGRIEGSGPRYCPSIEDKIVKFGDRQAHQVFLEPEGLCDSTVYPNGISTSLPEETQWKFVRSIRGLEKAEILQPGYAIEYDFVDPRELSSTLESHRLPRLFLAGQINGTTGYEEAGGQGLVAGINAAARSRDCAGFFVDRSASYLGVMIDDLVTRGVSEPYRMFTSRAEYRLSLRCDNADQRLTEEGARIGCVGDERLIRFRNKLDRLSAARTVLKELTLSPDEAAGHGISLNRDGIRRSAFDLLSMKEIDLECLAHVWPQLCSIDGETGEQVCIDARYAVYLERQGRDIERMRQDEKVRIPSDFGYSNLPGLSNELKEKLGRVRPHSLGQASRIDGMTPAALLLLAAHLRAADSRVRQSA